LEFYKKKMEVETTKELSTIKMLQESLKDFDFTQSNYSINGYDVMSEGGDDEVKDDVVFSRGASIAATSDAPSAQRKRSVESLSSSSSSSGAGSGASSGANTRPSSAPTEGGGDGEIDQFFVKFHAPLSSSEVLSSAFIGLVYDHVAKMFVLRNRGGRIELGFDNDTTIEEALYRSTLYFLGIGLDADEIKEMRVMDFLTKDVEGVDRRYTAESKEDVERANKAIDDASSIYVPLKKVKDLKK
jgi:hypothetical protein